MDTSSAEEDGGRPPQRWLRDLAAWSVGVAMSIAVNIVSGSTAPALRVALAALATGGVLGATYLIRRSDATSTLRHFLPPVLLTVASPLILMSVLGAWGGYLMFVAAALVAIAVSSKRGNVRATFVTLGGMALIAAGPVTVAAGLRDIGGGGLAWDAWSVVVGLVEVVSGGALLMWGERFLFQLIDEYTALRLLVMGLVLAVVGVSALVAAIRSPSNATVGLPCVGLAIATIGYCLAVLLTPERVDQVMARWRKLNEPRGLDEQNLSYGQAVMRFLERFGTVTPPGSHQRPVDPEHDSPGPS